MFHNSLLISIFLLSGLPLYAQDIAGEFKSAVPTEWGETVPGVKTRISKNEKILALTFDACGSANDGYDKKLIDFLTKEKVPATLFITGRWLDKFKKESEELSRNSLFEIENHGLNHKPASVKGAGVYGLEGTKNIGELIEEVEKNALKIESLTGRKPKFFRSGTAYYDDIAVKVIKKLGYEAAGFGVLGDAGATYSANKVKQQLLNAPAGSIIIMHMNHPEKDTAKGVIGAIPILKKRGFKFVKLEDYPLE
ncbi:MAG: polysaccharide deacetylase family protein [Elusimicrobia bacterium]|nr:polysaccharide deacetylase family protein [Candidatus Liberimonas magnetica]